MRRLHRPSLQRKMCRYNFGAMLSQCSAFSPVGYVADLKDTVARILEGLESNVLERSAAPRSLSSDYTRPDKQTAVMTFKSRFKK